MIKYQHPGCEVCSCPAGVCQSESINEKAARIKEERGTNWHVQTRLGSGLFVGEYIDAQKYAAVSDRTILLIDESTQTIILD